MFQRKNAIPVPQQLSGATTMGCGIAMNFATPHLSSIDDAVAIAR
jgi:hypothetical protein